MKNQKQKEILIEQLKKTPIVQVACEKTGISRASYYRWRKEDEAFAKIADEAITEGSLFINDMAESQLMSAIRDKNMTAIIFWLKHHHKNYATRVEVNASIKNITAELTEEQKSIIKEALRLASIDSENADHLLIKNNDDSNSNDNQPNADRPSSQDGSN